MTLLFILVSSHWFWHLLSRKKFSQIIAIFVVSLLLMIFSKVKSRLKYFLLLAPAIVVLLFPKGKNIFELNNLEIIQINTRRSYYSNQSLAKILENKPTRYLFNYQKNFFDGLDINYYFFATHPRERAGVEEIKRFSFVFAPFFLYGLFFQISRKKYLGVIYFLFTLAMISFFTPVDTFSFLLIPFLVVTINTGLWGALFKIKKLKIKNVP